MAVLGTADLGSNHAETQEFERRWPCCGSVPSTATNLHLDLTSDHILPRPLCFEIDFSSKNNILHHDKEISSDAAYPPPLLMSRSGIRDSIQC